MKERKKIERERERENKRERERERERERGAGIYWPVQASGRPTVYDSTPGISLSCCLPLILRSPEAGDLCKGALCLLDGSTDAVAPQIPIFFFFIFIFLFLSLFFFIIVIIIIIFFFFVFFLFFLVVVPRPPTTRSEI